MRGLGPGVNGLGRLPGAVCKFTSVLWEQFGRSEDQRGVWSLICGLSRIVVKAGSWSGRRTSQCLVSLNRRLQHDRDLVHERDLGHKT